MAAFEPRMRAQRRGIEAIDGVRRPFEGGCVEVWRAACAAGANGDYVSKDPRLFVVLEPLSAPMAFCDAGRQVAVSKACGVSFVPAGMELSSSFDSATSIRHLDVHLSADRLYGLIGGGPDLKAPRLMAVDDRTLAIARLLAMECASTAPLPALYGDSLTAALISAALGRQEPPKRRRSRLSDRKLKSAVDYIEGNCLRSIRLQELAELTGLTQTYFSHAFKAATGVPPLRWQMNARIRRAQELLRVSDTSLTAIAAETGFSDQAHFTRVFRQVVGQTPAAWQSEHG